MASPIDLSIRGSSPESIFDWKLFYRLKLQHQENRSTHLNHSILTVYSDAKYNGTSATILNHACRMHEMLITTSNVHTLPATINVGCGKVDKVLGFSPHPNGDLITLVLQVNQVQGLQIKKNGKWAPVKPLLGAFIANVGDVFEIFSNGRYKSIEHSAVVRTEKERLSIATFHSPNHGAMIGPLPELARGSEVSYRTIDHENFMKLFFSAGPDGKSFLDRMKLRR